MGERGRGRRRKREEGRRRERVNKAVQARGANSNEFKRASRFISGYRSKGIEKQTGLSSFLADQSRKTKGSENITTKETLWGEINVLKKQERKEMTKQQRKKR